MDIKLYGLAVVMLLLSVPTSGIPQGYFSDSVFEGPCPNVPVMQNFNRQQFYGDWHEISRIEHDIQRNADCVTLQLEKVLTGIARIQFESHFLSNNSHLNRNGIAFVSRPADNLGDFNVTWEANQDSDYDQNIQYFRFRIIETDYTDYAIMYDCVEVNTTFNSDFFWVLSRNRELATDAQARVTVFRQQWNIATGLRDTEQRYSECKYFDNSEDKFLVYPTGVMAAQHCLCHGYW